MNRSSLMLSMLSVSACLGAFVACVDAGVGGVCNTDADCGDGMICDVHDGQGTCQHDHGHETHGDTHGDTHGETHGGEVDCSMEDRDDEYAPGLERSGAIYTATFVSVEPDPPALDDNDWVVAITDGAGEAAEDLTILATPWMPDHGHGTPIEVVVAATENPGEYSLSPVNLFMAGLWQVTLEIDGEGGQDSIMFAFCVSE